MSDRDALLNAIAAFPLDDTPKLVFCDWLDENGEDALAAWLRVSIAAGTPDEELAFWPLVKRVWAEKINPGPPFDAWFPKYDVRVSKGSVFWKMHLHAIQLFEMKLTLRELRGLKSEEYPVTLIANQSAADAMYWRYLMTFKSEKLLESPLFPTFINGKAWLEPSAPAAR